MKLNRMHVIISACCGIDDAANTAELENYLKNRNFQYDVATGCYEGDIEPSFIVQIPEFYVVGDLLQQAKKYTQEAILLVDAYDNSFMLYVNTNVIKPLGLMFQTQDVGKAIDRDAYTLSGGVIYYTV